MKRFLLFVTLLFVLDSCGPFNYDPAPWMCTTKAGEKDCAKAKAERDSTARLDSLRTDSLYRKKP